MVRGVQLCFVLLLVCANVTTGLSADIQPFFDTKSIEREYAIALNDFQRGRYEVAFIHAGNVLVWLDFAEDKGGKFGKKLEKIRSVSRARFMLTDRPCPICGGDGHARVPGFSIWGNIKAVPDKESACAVCEGSGLLEGRKSPKEVSRSLARAREGHSLVQTRKGMKNVRGVWIPGRLYRQLSRQQKKAFKKAAPHVCPDCSGIGLVGCSTCGGTGVVPCPDQGCIMGIKASGTKSNLITEPCETCKGKAVITCPDCGGKKLLPCDACRGTGENRR
ncbi:MAG: hypothetical protein KJ626_15140 [Verrucomicrobia bacterium]|nr:hypothetical protein [Verrucomicrobiota bacterium]